MPTLLYTYLSFCSTCLTVIFQVRRIPLNGDDCDETVSIDIGTQPKDLHVVPQFPERALVLTESGVVMLHGSNIVSTINLGFPVTASAVSPDGREAWVGGQDGRLHVYSIKGDMLMEETILEKHQGAITAICYSPNALFVASGDTNREAVVWDRISKEVLIMELLHSWLHLLCSYFCGFFFLLFDCENWSIYQLPIFTCVEKDELLRLDLHD